MKLKIAPGHDVDAVAAVRAEVGPGVTLQVDANGSYTLADADRLAALDALGVACLEQPLAPDALLDHARLAARMRHPDRPRRDDHERGASRVTRCELGACAIVSIKSALVGGVDRRAPVHDVCVDAGVAARAGRDARDRAWDAPSSSLWRHYPGFTVTGDLSASVRYFAHDVTEPFELDAGRLAVPTGPGIGVAPLPEMLARCTVARERWRAAD